MKFRNKKITTILNHYPSIQKIWNELPDISQNESCSFQFLERLPLPTLARLDADELSPIVDMRQVLAYRHPGLDLALTMQGLSTEPLRHFGQHPRHEEWKDKALSGQAVGALALTEPNAGSDLRAIESLAEPTPDGYRLRGKKHLISNAVNADFATVFAMAPQGLSAFVLDMDQPGITRWPQTLIGDHDIGGFSFDIHVTKDALIGEEGRGMRIALTTLSKYRPSVGAAALGMARRALDESWSYCLSRSQFGKPLAAQPVVRNRLADMATKIEAMDALVSTAANKYDAKSPDAPTLGNMAKLFATEEAFHVVDQAVQLHGGLGLHSESVVAKLLLDLRALRIYEGASDILREVIARSLESSY